MSKIATREAYGKALSQLTKENKNIIPLITPTAAGTKERDRKSTRLNSSH